MNRAIFIDKDGTLIRDVAYNVDPQHIQLLDGVIEGLKRLKAEGYLTIIISNQSGVAYGYFRELALNAVVDRIRELLGIEGLTLDGFYYCPHHPSGKIEQYAVHCDCRKPKPGMLLQAAADLDIDLSASWMIGDILDDVEAGKMAGCKTILINNGNETEWIRNSNRKPDFIVNNMVDAAGHILNL